MSSARSSFWTIRDRPEFRNYRQEVREWKKICESYGFRGEYMATESGWYAPYPPPEKPFGGGANTEIVKAKYLAHYITMSVGLDLTTFWNTTWHHYIWWDLGLFRNSFSADPVSPTQPQPAYYVLRTLCTLLDSAEPAEIAPEFSHKEAEFDVDAFRLPGNRMLVAVSIPGRATDDGRRVTTGIRFAGIKWKRAFGIDPLNGVEQPLNASGGRLEGMVIKDYPTFIRLELA